MTRNVNHVPVSRKLFSLISFSSSNYIPSLFETLQRHASVSGRNFSLCDLVHSALRMTLLSADDDGGGSDIVNNFCCVSSSAEECINDSKMTGKFTQLLLSRRFFPFLHALTR